MAFEVEFVKHSAISDINLFVVSLQHRNAHLHRDLELTVTLDGRTTLETGSKRFISTAGDCYVMNSNQTHEFLPTDEAATALALQISPRFLAHTSVNIANVVFETPIPGNPEAIRRLMIEAAIIYFEKKPYYELHCLEKLYAILNVLFSETPHHYMKNTEQNQMLRRVHRLDHLMDFVEANYMHKINLQTFADKEELSLQYLSNFVKENLHMTFRDYVASVRVHHACKLLRSGNRYLSEICLEVGFSDMRYMREGFEKHLGLTPEAYRAMYSGNNATVDLYEQGTNQDFWTDAAALALLKRVQP